MKLYLTKSRWCQLWCTLWTRREILEKNFCNSQSCKELQEHMWWKQLWMPGKLGNPTDWFEGAGVWWCSEHVLWQTGSTSRSEKEGTACYLSALWQPLPKPSDFTLLLYTCGKKCCRQDESHLPVLHVYPKRWNLLKHVEKMESASDKEMPGTSPGPLHHEMAWIPWCLHQVSADFPMSCGYTGGHRLPIAPGQIWQDVHRWPGWWREECGKLSAAWHYNLQLHCQFLDSIPAADISPFNCNRQASILLMHIRRYDCLRPLSI